jgi:hypothetical protein
MADPSAMMLDEVVDCYCRAWSDDDPVSRRALLESVWGATATYADPSAATSGVDALIDHITSVRKRFPCMRIVRTSVVDAHHATFRFAWRSQQPDGTLIREGVDFGERLPSGRLGRIDGFFGPLAALATT